MAGDSKAKYDVRLFNKDKPDEALKFKCPGCNVWGEIDEDQLYGKVSCWCRLCGWHETVNLITYSMGTEVKK